MHITIGPSALKVSGIRSQTWRSLTRPIRYNTGVIRNQGLWSTRICNIIGSRLEHYHGTVLTGRLKGWDIDWYGHNGGVDHG